MPDSISRDDRPAGIAAEACAALTGNYRISGGGGLAVLQMVPNGLGEAARNAAIFAQISLLGPGTFELGTGTFFIGTTITLGSGQCLRGVAAAPGGTELVFLPGAGLLIAGDQASVEDLALSASSFDGQSGAVLATVQARSVRLTRLRLTGAIAGISLGRARATRIESVWIEDCGVGVLTDGTSSSTLLEACRVTTGDSTPTRGWGVTHRGRGLLIRGCSFDASSAPPGRDAPALIANGTALECRFNVFLGPFPHVVLGRPAIEQQGGLQALFSAGGGHLIEHNTHLPNSEDDSSGETSEPVESAAAEGAAVVRALGGRLGECIWNLLRNGSFEFWREGMPRAWEIFKRPDPDARLAIAEVVGDATGVWTATQTAYGRALAAAGMKPTRPGRLPVGRMVDVGECYWRMYDELAPPAAVAGQPEGAPPPATSVFELQIPRVRDGARAMEVRMLCSKRAESVEFAGTLAPTGNRGPGPDHWLTFSCWVRATDPEETSPDIHLAIRQGNRRVRGPSYRFDTRLDGTWQRLSVRAPWGAGTANIRPLIVVGVAAVGPNVAPGSLGVVAVFDGALVNPGLLIMEPGDTPLTTDAAGVSFGPVEFETGVPMVITRVLTPGSPVIRIPVTASGVLESIQVAGDAFGAVQVAHLDGETYQRIAVVSNERLVPPGRQSAIKPLRLGWSLEPGMTLELRQSPVGATLSVELRCRHKVRG